MPGPRPPRIQASYTDGLGRARRAPREAVDAIKRILRESQKEPALDPVAVAWDGRGHLRVAKASGRVSVEIALEGGGRVTRRATVSRGRIEMPRLPLGYHRAHVTGRGIDGEALIISAPRRTHQGEGRRLWGLFVPLYAVRSERDWGAGNLGDLADMVRRVAARGGDLVATLPLLAGFYDKPYDPSPYAPASRLYWSELFLDIERVPELKRSREASERVASRAFRAEVARLRSTPLVDYRAGMALRRSVLEECARALAPARRAALEKFLRKHPDTRTYAKFRARTEQTGRPWRRWPAGPPEPDPDRVAYHCYVQFLCAEQLGEVARACKDAGAALYLDMPLGVHPAGYDVWRYRDIFAEEVSTGAPPDSFFTAGQDWSNPPLLPGRVRASGYAYPRACLRTLMSHAGVVRIDHIIGLHRTYWIPRGFAADEGVFVRWPDPKEWYAIVALESHRARAIVVGEDLGTVPREVRAAMARHGILRTYVQQEEFDARGNPNPVRADALAALNTHDMPTFRAFVEARDIAERRRAGLLDAASEKRERTRRVRRVAGLERSLKRKGFMRDDDLLGAALERLAASPARVVLASTADLLGMHTSHNRPGTAGGANWRRKEGKQIGALDATDRLERMAKAREESRT